MRKAALDGVIVGGIGAISFLLLHAVIVEPIWDRAWRAPLALVNGAILGLVYARLRAREPKTFGHPLGGMLLGALVGVSLAPFAIVGWMRARGAPDPFWILILALLSLSVWHLTQAVQTEGEGSEEGGRRTWRERATRWELPIAILLANAFPFYFLTFIADFHDETPDPFPMSAATAVIYVACGALLTMLSRRKVSGSDLE